MSKLIIEMLGGKVTLCALLTLCVRVGHVAALDFANSKWIWTSSAGSTYTVPPLATADFRQDFTAPLGKIPVSANVIITADNIYTLYVNGQFIGQGYDWQISQGYCVKLDLGYNVFAVAVQNQAAIPTPAAFIAAINVTYTDGTSSIIVSDDSWRANNNETVGFESPGFDDSTWPSAVVVGNADSAPWQVPSLPVPSSALTLGDSYWIWNTQVPPNSPTSNAPAGNFAFRKTFKVFGSSSVQSGTIIIDVDNSYTLYVNGQKIGTGGTWTKAQRWTITFDSPVDTIVLAIAATNNEGPAGFIIAVSFDAHYGDYCSTSLVKYTDRTPDGTWKFNLAVPDGFEHPGYNDSDWSSTIVEGLYAVSPWGSVPIVNGN